MVKRNSKQYLYPWMYYLTLYGLNNKNELNELYTGSFIDRL